MAAEIVMPRMSDTMEEGRIVRWLKKPGDPVAKGEPLADIETDKAVMQLESYESGVLQEVRLAEGQSAPIGQVIALIGVGAPAAAAPSKPAARAEAPREQAAPSPAPAAAQRPVEAIGERILASPIARRIAEEHGLDLSKVQGSGPGGRITREDVEGAIGSAALKKEEERGKAVPPPAAAPAPTRAAPAAPPPPPTAPVEELIELPRIRRTIVERVVQSKTTVPHFYVTVEADMTEAVALRKRLNAAWAPETLSVTDLIVRAVALALRSYPNVNSSYHDGKIERHAQVNVGVAVALPDEVLLVPVVREADGKPLRAIARETKALIQRTREGKPIAGDFGGSTFTISNLGMLDVEEFNAIITPPESAILAVGSVKAKPVVVDDAVTVSQRMRLTLSGDHRVFAGETAARFLGEIKRLLGNPLELLQ